MEKEQSIVHRLNDLVQVCKDSEYGFRQAASETGNKQHRALLWASSRQRKDFACQLQEEVRKLGLNPAQKGSLLGRLHRTWMNLRYQMNFRNESVVLKECQRGEESALRVYENAFDSRLPKQVESILDNQFVHFIEMRDQLAAILKPREKERTKGSMLQL